MKSLSSSFKAKKLDLLNAPLPEGKVNKCECCNQSKYGCEWQEVSKSYLCLGCKSKIESKRMSEMLKAEQKKLENSILLNEAELKGLKADGLITLRTYIYLAFRIDGLSEHPQSVEILKFCTKWMISKEDLIGAAASLSKRGAIYLNIDKFTAQVFSHEERVHSLEESLKNGQLSS